MIIKELKEAHPEIYKLALQCQIDAGNKINDKIDLNEPVYGGNFDWNDSKPSVEDRLDWEEIYDGNFDHFYKIYPHLKPVTSMYLIY